MSSDKVTLAQAAAHVGSHVNTIKNWRRSNELKTAEKIIERGVEVWYVELDEVVQLAAVKRHKGAVNIVDNVGYPNDTPPGGVAGNGAAPGGGGPGQLLGRSEQTMLELINQTQKPLLDMIEKRDTTIQELSAKLGSLEEKLRAYEAAQGAVAAPAGAGDSVAAIVPANTSRPAPGPPAAPGDTVVKVVWWRRLIGG